MTHDQRDEMEMTWRVKQSTHLPVGVGPEVAASEPRLTGTRCAVCGVALTDEYGWKAGKTARWHSFAPGAPKECCRACAEDLDRVAAAALEEERKQWPSVHYGTIAAWLKAQRWRPLAEVYPGDAGKRWDWFTHCGRWVIQWRRGGWVLAEAPDYNDLVERTSGVTIHELVRAVERWEVRG